jgi:catechol 2,3-dioxygenase-like lactoylglutathione lyase family enzyme
LLEREITQERVGKRTGGPAARPISLQSAGGDLAKDGSYGDQLQFGHTRLRIFNIDNADEFYQGFLGFTVDWDHRFNPGAPLYRQTSRGNLVLHLSEHHGDGSPRVHIRVMMDGVEALQRELSAKGYPYMRPGVETMPWGMIETGVIDPFGNFIRFCERVERPAAR